MSTTMAYRCRICLAEFESTPLRARELMFESGEEFKYIECRSCGCVQIETIPPDLARHYPNNYYSQRQRSEPSGHRGLKRQLVHFYTWSTLSRRSPLWRHTVQGILPLPADFEEFGEHLAYSGLKGLNDQILDVGCGASPYRLAAYARLGFKKLLGIDPFLDGDTDYHGIPVLRRSLEQMSGVFSLIMFHHSLEHVPDPVKTLSAAADRLAEGGTCLVRVPIAGTYFWRRFGVNWVELDAPRHLHLFSPESLRVLAERSGLKVVRTTFDSSAWELSASLDCEQGLSVHAHATPTSRWTDADRAHHQGVVDQLNRACWAGRACYYLTKV